MWFRRDGNLQTMCLNVVVSDINILCLPNAVPEKHIEFLRRVYSETLYKLITDGLYSNRYLVWLISPYWKNVSLPGLGYQNSDILSKFTSVGRKLDSLHLEYSDLSHHFLSAMICCVPKITVLNLTGTLITDDISRLIRKMCPNLNTLNLSFCEYLTDTGIRNLCYLNKKLVGYPSLQNLNISETHIRIEGLIFLLKHLSSLKILNFAPTVFWLYCIHGRLHDHCASDSIVKYNITNFEYSEVAPYATADLDSVLEVLSRICPLVEEATIRKKITENTFHLLREFKCLKQLHLINSNFYYPTKFPSISPFFTARGSVITNLSLSKISVSVDVITNFCPNLESLELCSVVYENFESSVKSTKVAELKKLKLLCLNNLSFSNDVDFKSADLLIRSSINLNNVKIHGVKRFTDKIARVILKLTNLVAVDFSFTDINEETLLPFFAYPNIQTIRIDGCPFISDNDKTSFISKLMRNSYHGKNTCSWELGYD